MEHVLRRVHDHLDSQFVDDVGALSTRLGAQHPGLAQLLTVLRSYDDKRHALQLAQRNTFRQQVKGSNFGVLCHGPWLLPPKEARHVWAKAGAGLTAHCETRRDNLPATYQASHNTVR